MDWSRQWAAESADVQASYKKRAEAIRKQPDADLSPDEQRQVIDQLFSRYACV